MACQCLIPLATILASLTTLVTIGFVNGLVWYGRLHMRLIRPALQTTGSVA